MAKPSFPALPPESRDELAQWMLEHGESLPESVRVALGHYEALVAALSESNRKLSGVLSELRRALGMTPKSERRRPSGRALGPISGGDGKRPKSLREKLALSLERMTRLSGWHRDISMRQGKNADRIKERLESLPEDELAPTPEEQRQMEEETRQQMERYQQGDAPDATLQSVAETLMAGAQITTSDDVVELAAPEPVEPVEVVKEFTEERIRYDFTLTVTRVVAEVEKKVVVDKDGKRRMLSGSTASLGPPRYAVTWAFLTNLSMMAVQYAMPLNRMATLLSTEEKRFTSSSLSRMLRYVGERFAPIYLQLFAELCDSEILMGDDTPPRVLDVRRYFAQTGSDEPPPWHTYRTQEVAAALRADEEEVGLEALLAAELGFEFERRTGDGPKRSLNTTVLAGRSEAADPRSLVVFYRTHLGGLGNLLEVLLAARSPAARAVVVQSDLATVNLVTDPQLLERFDIRRVGCASHARRPFALYEHEDPELCAFILHRFKGLAIHEYGLDLHGRNVENVTAIRGVDSREMWEDMKRICEMMTQRWSQETKLGQGARYILRHYDALTAYLDDPRIAPTNNFSERMLRMEKLIEGGSMFRATLGGRFVLDILRTILQTAVAARAPLQEYVMFVLQTPAEEIAAAPELYTPLAWAQTYLDNIDDEDEAAAAPDF